MTEVPIVVIAWRTVEVDTARCLQEAEQTGRYNVVFSHNDALVSRSRSLALSRFLRGSDSDVMLFVDTDIVFSTTDVDRVVALAREKKSIAGGAYSVRRAHEAWPAIRFKPGTPKVTFGPRGEPIVVDYVSGGFMAIHKDVLQKLSETMPLCTAGSSSRQPLWFFCQPFAHKYGEEWEPLSEDWALCQRAQDAGFEIWLDTRVALGHLGVKLYKLSQMQDFGPTEIERGDLVTDVTKFFKMKPEAVIAKGSSSRPRDKLNKKWERTNPKNQAEVDELLNAEETIWDDFYHYTKVDKWSGLDSALRCTGRVGILHDPLGCLTLALTRRRALAYPIRTSKAQEKFMEWRFRVHNTGRKIFPSLSDVPTKMDFIVGVEYVEHQHPDSYPEFAEQVHNALVPGGQLLLFGNWAPEGDSRVFAGGREAFSGAMLNAGMTARSGRWVKKTEAEATDGHDQDRLMVVDDLATYTGKKTAEVSEHLLLGNPAKQTLADAWREANPETPAEVDDYYKAQEAYIYDLAWFNAHPSYWAQNRSLLELSGRIVDFGGGIGTLSIALGRRGCEVAYVDLPSPQRTFAEWRFARQDYPISVHDSLDTVGEVDAIVATDTMEHIHPDALPSLAGKMFDALRDGGRAYTINKFFDSGDEPMHYASGGKFEESMRGAGFGGGPTTWTKPVS